jgi:hypothetical protein
MVKKKKKSNYATVDAVVILIWDEESYNNNSEFGGQSSTHVLPGVQYAPSGSWEEVGRYMTAMRDFLRDYLEGFRNKVDDDGLDNIISNIPGKQRGLKGLYYIDVTPAALYGTKSLELKKPKNDKITFRVSKSKSPKFLVDLDFSKGVLDTANYEFYVDELKRIGVEVTPKKQPTDFWEFGLLLSVAIERQELLSKGDYSSKSLEKKVIKMNGDIDFKYEII